MCEGSVYVQHRRSTEREELTLKSIPDYNMKGFYQTDKASNRLVCTLPGTKIVVDEVRFTARTTQIRRGITPTVKQGDRDVPATLRGIGSRAGDAIEFEDGSAYHLAHFLDGMTIGIGRPVMTLDDKLHLDDKSLRSVSADIEREEPIVEHQAPRRRRILDTQEGDD